jgi:hypothetical protein
MKYSNFSIEIELFNSAFEIDAPGCPDHRDLNREEIARILKNISDKIQCHDEDGIIRDINGNNVGSWSLTEDINADEND